MIKIFFYLGLIFIFSACSSSFIVPTYNIKSSFNEKEARTLLKKGNNTIKGEAFLRQLGGGVITCAGSQVSLAPATKYADERIKMLYLSNEKGYNSKRNYKFTPIEPLYDELTKTTICNSSGKFVFNNISNGSFYIVVPVVWQARSKQGGALMQKVSVKNGEVKELIMTE